MSVESAVKTISFARGAPSLDIVDVDGLSAAAERAAKNDPAGTFSYGTAVGYRPLRSWIANRYAVDDDRVMVTNGSMQADAFLFDCVVKPGDAVIVERPTYDRTLLGLTNRGANVVAIDVESDGINVDQLEVELKAGLRPKLAHIIPNFQNPAGVTLSLAKRKRLIALASEYDFLIFEDDPYVEIRFEGETLPTMFSLDPEENVVYVSSYTKTVCPGVRVGYMVGPTSLIAETVKLATNTYISPCMFSQATVYEFCKGGSFEPAVETVKTALKERVDVLAESLSAEIPGALFEKPEGGYFMWITLPSGVTASGLFAAAAQRGVQIVKGTDFVSEGGEDAIRLAYSAVGPDEIREGVQRLADAVASLS